MRSSQKTVNISLALLMMSSLSGCGSITSWNPFSEARQRSMPSERRAPAMNPGGNGQSHYPSQAAPPMAQAPVYYQPAPAPMAAAPMPQAPVIAQALPPAMGQGYAPNYYTQPQPAMPRPQAMPTPQELAQYAPAAGNPSLQPLAQYAPASAPMAIYPGPIAVTAPQYPQQAQAVAPADPTMFGRMSGYAQPESAQNQGYPQLSEPPPPPPKRQPDEYQRLLQALEYERQQNAALQQALQGQAAALSPASVMQQPSPAMVAPQQPAAQPAITAPFVAPRAVTPAQMPQMMPQEVPQMMTQATPAMPLPSGVYVFNPSDGNSITLTQPGGAAAIAVPPSRYSTRRGYSDRTL